MQKLIFSVVLIWISLPVHSGSYTSIPSPVTSFPLTDTVCNKDLHTLPSPTINTHTTNEIYSVKKQNFLNRILLKVVQKRWEKRWKKMQELPAKKNAKRPAPNDFFADFHTGGFLLGLLLPPLGLLIAYLIKDKKQKQRFKWAKIGFGTFLTFAILIIALLLAVGGLHFR